MDATDDSLDFGVMAQLIRAWPDPVVPPKNTVVCHLRIGDVFEIDWVGGTDFTVDEILHNKHLRGEPRFGIELNQRQGRLPG